MYYYNSRYGKQGVGNHSLNYGQKELKMEKINEIEELIQPALDENNVHLYQCKWVKMGKIKVLQIAITKDSGIDLDICSKVSESISEIIDEKLDSNSEYMLEVCSAGAERELRTIEEVRDVIGKQIFVKINKPIKTIDEFQGELLSLDNNEVRMNYRDKSLTREVTFNYEDADFIRLAVKM